MRIACVQVDHFPFRLEAARNPGLAKNPAIIFQRQGSQRTVLDASPIIEGVMSGMPLGEAQALCKNATLIEADMPRYKRVSEHILLQLGQWSPIVDPAGLGSAYVGLNGLETTYGTEERLIDALIQAVPRNLEARLGIGHGKFMSYLAATKALPGGAYKPFEDAKVFAAPFSVDVLPVTWQIMAQLHSFGLHTLGDVADLPLGPVQAQFGKIGSILWQLSQGVDDSPVLPIRPHEETAESLSFAAPTAMLGPLLLAIESLIKKLFGRPEMRGRYARLAVLEAQILNRPPWVRRIHFKTSLSDTSRAFFVIRSSLENLVLPGPLEDIRITLKGLTGEAGRQESLFRDVRRRDQLRETVAQLREVVSFV